MGEKEARGYLMLNNKTYFVYEGLNTIGRNPQAVLNIKNIKISQMHAIITVVDEENHYISDLKSCNGTTIDHTKLTPLKLYPLKHGASVKLGNIYGAYKKIDGMMGAPALDDTQMTQSCTQTFYANNTQILTHNTQDSTFNELPTQIQTFDEDASSNSSIDFVTMAQPTQKFDGSPEEVLSQIQPVAINRVNPFDSDEEEIDSSIDNRQNVSRYVISDDESETDVEDDDKNEAVNQSNLMDSLRLSASQTPLEPINCQKEGLSTEETAPSVDTVQETSADTEAEDIQTAEKATPQLGLQRESAPKEAYLILAEGVVSSLVDLETVQEDLPKSAKEREDYEEVVTPEKKQSEEEIEGDEATQQLDLKTIQEGLVSTAEEKEGDEATQPLDFELVQEGLVIPAEEREDNEEVVTPEKKKSEEEIEGDEATQPLDFELIQEDLVKPAEDEEVVTPDKSTEELKKSEEEIEGDEATQQLNLETIEDDLDIPAEEKQQKNGDNEEAEDLKDEATQQLDLDQEAQAVNHETINQNLHIQVEDIDIYELPTQKLSNNGESSRLLKKDDDDIYLQATQTQEPFVNNSDDDSFLRPTQDKSSLNDVSKHLDDNDDDFLMPTQSPKQIDIFRKPSLSLKKSSKSVKLLEDDDFLAPTQAMMLLHGMDAEEEVEKPKRLEDELESIFASQSISCTQKLVADLEKPEEIIDDSFDHNGIMSSQSIRDILGEGLKVPIMSSLTKTSEDTKTNSEESTPSTSTGIRHNKTMNEDNNIIEEKKKNVKIRQKQNKIEEQKENMDETEGRSTRGRKNKTVEATIVSNDKTITEKKKTSLKQQRNNESKSQDNIDDLKEDDNTTASRKKNIKTQGKNQSQDGSNEDNLTNLEDDKINPNKKRNVKKKDNLKPEEINEDNKREPLGTRNKRLQKKDLDSSDDEENNVKVEPARTRGRKPKVLDLDMKKAKAEKKSTNDDLDEDNATISRKPRNVVKTRAKNKMESQEETVESIEKPKVELASTRSTRKTKVESLVGSSEDEETTLRMEPPSMDSVRKTRGRKPNVSSANKRKLEEKAEISEKKMALDDSSADFTSSRLIASTPLREHKASTSRAGSKRKGLNLEEDQVTIESPKKNRRLSANSRMVKLETSFRNTEKRILKPKVVFTMIDDPTLEAIVRRLGGSVVDTVKECTVLVTESVKRTHKLLCAVGEGKAIVSPEWLNSSKKNSKFLDCWDYILRDKEAEKKWNFSLSESLARGAQAKLLEGHVFQLIVSAAADVLKGAIESCGGSVVTRGLASAKGELFIVSTENNKAKYSKIVKQNPGIKVIEPEAIFDGTLRKEFRFNEFTLN